MNFDRIGKWRVFCDVVFFSFLLFSRDTWFGMKSWRNKIHSTSLFHLRVENFHIFTGTLLIELFPEFCLRNAKIQVVLRRSMDIYGCLENFCKNNVAFDKFTIYNFEITYKTTFKRFYRNLYQIESEIYKLILTFQIM